MRLAGEYEIKLVPALVNNVSVEPLNICLTMGDPPLMLILFIVGRLRRNGPL